jgi:hypothetical protein
MLYSVNVTHIALIPKKMNPCCVFDYKPISLCNVVYKLISKVLPNRMKRVLPHIISPTQSAFLPGHLITDNVLITYETLHTVYSWMWSKTGYIGIKLDMSKAYNMVEWLKNVMEKMEFLDKWIRLIMECVNTITYSILINGEPVGNILPSRGLR